MSRYYSEIVRKPRSQNTNFFQLWSENRDGVELCGPFPILKQMVTHNMLTPWLQQLWKSKATTSSLIDPKIVQNIRFIGSEYFVVIVVIEYILPSWAAWWRHCPVKLFQSIFYRASEGLYEAKWRFLLGAYHISVARGLLIKLSVRREPEFE